MPASQENLTPRTPLGATLLPGGLAVRFWAPAAERVYIAFDEQHPEGNDDLELVRDAAGVWGGFFRGVGTGRKYRFYVVGAGGRGFKRDPRARELELYGYPDCDGLTADPDEYPWHDAGWTPPRFTDLIVYQLHVGVFSGSGRGPAKFLDALRRVPYLARLGVTAIQPLPVVEFQGEWSLGYNGTDLFSPEMDYCLDPDDLGPHLEAVNALLAERGADPLKPEQLAGQAAQLKAFVDVCHLYGIAVLFDVVYNHAGGGLDRQSLDYIDLPADPGPHNNAYFSDQGWAGGRVFAFHRPEVRAFLTDNAALFLDEYHADGLRFDEVSVIDRMGGRGFCQEMTAALHERKPSAALIAEYWGEHRWLAVQPPPAGMGFDLGYADGLRDAVRDVLHDVARGGSGPVGVGRLARGLHRPAHLRHAWQAYQCLENHDLVLDMDDHRDPRIASLADASNPRSWYARSRSRVATGVLLTAPGTPMLFMGQEFLEDKLWSDSPGRTDRRIWWDGALGGDRHMADFLRCTTDLIALRRELPALRSDALHVYAPDEDNRVLAYQRDNVVVVLSFKEQILYGYELGLPQPGRWREAFNTDWYDHWPNPWVAGNGGSVRADRPGRHGFAQSAALTIPANGLLVFVN
ncbi:alpha amylase C-terminal domain-containing protein [Paractinoplanes rishiriensis]|uniref:alpha amylase C-terminal domain-containing protein n=1 Tax=Paractinoplanes rishiriensis TaxID=1050105 RepID=UPI001942944A|nr:alpha amylase C-terminal domain-containing protein [Actinoplanes rishiriensis]